MKCIETRCSSFYVDPLSKECVLGTLEETCVKSPQPNDGITVYRNKDSNKLDCLDCSMETDINYAGYDLNNGGNTSTNDAGDCRLFCKSNYPMAKYFTFTPTLQCWCKTSSAVRRKWQGCVSGKVICTGE